MATEQRAQRPVTVTVMRPPPSRVEYWRRVNRHRFDPVFSAAGECWCGRGAGGWIHRSDVRLTDTPLGAQLLDLQRRRTTTVQR